MAIFRRTEPQAKVVLHLFKKPLFSGSIGNAIAFNTSSVLRLARNLVRKIDRPGICRSHAGDNFSERIARLKLFIAQKLVIPSRYSRDVSERYAKPAEMDSKAMQPASRVVTSSFTPDITWD